MFDIEVMTEKEIHEMYNSLCNKARLERDVVQGTWVQNLVSEYMNECRSKSC